MPVPGIRVTARNGAPVRPEGRHVLYWMTANRRTRFNFALQHAAERARALGRPLWILEALRCDYPWASDRLHATVCDGMRANAARCREAGVAYFPYVEPAPGAGRGLLAALAADACLVVADDYPCFFLPAMVARAAERLPVRVEAVDANGLLPMAAADRAFPTAYGFRRFLQRELRPHLACPPEADPLWGLERAEARRVGDWTPGIPDDLAALPIDHSVPAVARDPDRLARFLPKLDRYAELGNHPDEHATSRLSADLHFGHVGAHEVFRAVAEREEWTIDALAPKADGKRAGWWGMGAGAEAFLDQLVTWREVGFNRCAHDPRYDEYDTLPEWARATLEQHAGDPRPHLYALEELAAAATDDPIWNAAQRELVATGRIHNYLRMLWGKRILEWTPGPREALAAMIELNNRYALDGRDPNSYSGIFWVLGRYDRAWGPERPVFGKVRYMSSANTRRKLRLKEYCARWLTASS